MATIKVFNNDENRMETYIRGENDAMPYNTGSTMKVREFRGSSKSELLWTEKRAMQAWNSFRAGYGKPIYIGFAFKRPYEGGHGQMSQHYAGLAFDLAQTTTNAERAAIRTFATNSKLWGYVEPVSLSPTWVHIDRRRGTPACSTGGYPTVRSGAIGSYVLVLQDALTKLGFSTNGIDGIFGNGTRNAVIAYQKSRGFTADGITGCMTWSRLMHEVVGKYSALDPID